MGEYATRKADKHDIKIGTCEQMYYIRYEDRNQVAPLEGSLDCAKEDGLYWRLPVKEEDGILPGNYESMYAEQRLCKYDAKRETIIDFKFPESAKNPGSIPLAHENGLRISVPCLHGESLPEIEGARVGWNGKTHSYVLQSIKNTTDGIKAVVACRHCGNAWRFDIADIIDYVNDPTLKERLLEYDNI